MPINPSILGTPEPDEKPENPPLGQPSEEKATRTRRTKAQLIADAVVPGDDDQVELKDLGTGAKIQRPWLVALEMVRDKKAEWADKSMKYAMLKYDQQKAAPAFDQSSSDQGGESGGAEAVAAADDAPSETPSSQERNVPPEAEVGDEVRIGSDTFRVGHGNVLVPGDKLISESGSSKLINAKRRWQRQLGSGPDGPWESTSLILPTESNGNGNGGGIQVETETQPAEIRQVGEIEWKVGTGILQKIGLPQIEQFAGGSGLQIGPVTASRTVLDDGRRMTVPIGDRVASLPTAVIEAYQELTDACEYVARYQRGELVSFLEAVGALKQPVS